MTERLAIVIPAYKSKYFALALASLAAQTNKEFTVYIGDDCSPESLTTIVEEYRTKLTIKYHRFPNNVGSKNLVRQWNRCVQLTESEEWICLFSDDDMMDSNCVEQFYNTLKENPSCEVFRFNTIIIDGEDKILQRNPVSPEYETAEELAYNILLGKRGNVIGDHIFSRHVFDTCNGFVFTDFAQAADWASSIKFSAEKGIRLISGAHYYWRFSGTNISSTAFRQRNATMRGHLQFIQWITEHFQYLRSGHQAINYEMMRKAAIYNLNHIIVSHYKGINLSFMWPLTRFYFSVLNLNFFAALKQVVRLKIQTSSRLRNLNKRLRIFSFDLIKGQA
jgi:glycosyltransferase involved in cell wall biosynthesis